MKCWVTEYYGFLHNQRRIQDFPEGDANPKRGRQPIIWPKFAQKCMKMKKIGPRKDGHTSKILLCRSATDNSTSIPNSDPSKGFQWISMGFRVESDSVWYVDIYRPPTTDNCLCSYSRVSRSVDLCTAELEFQLSI